MDEMNAASTGMTTKDRILFLVLVVETAQQTNGSRLRRAETKDLCTTESLAWHLSLRNRWQTIKPVNSQASVNL